MKTETLNEKAEEIKDTIKGTTEKSKDTIREIISSSSKFIVEALDTNQKFVDSVKDKLNLQNMEDTITIDLKNTFGKSVELAEDTINIIMNTYSKQMEMNVDINSKLVDAIKDTNSYSTENVLNLIQKNFEASREMYINNTKEILEAYNKHTNLAVNFNKKFGESINSQIESIFDIQTRGFHKFSELTSVTSEWWKHAEKSEN